MQYLHGKRLSEGFNKSKRLCYNAHIFANAIEILPSVAYIASYDCRRSISCFILPNDLYHCNLHTVIIGDVPYDLFKLTLASVF